MTTWVGQTRAGVPDGNTQGFRSRPVAESWIEGMRALRDESPMYAAFREQEIDWVIIPEVEFAAEEQITTVPDEEH